LKADEKREKNERPNVNPLHTRNSGHSRYRKHLWLFLMLAISGSHSHPTALRAAQTAESPLVKLDAFSVSSPFTPFLRL
jgi:hypothetical protein